MEAHRANSRTVTFSDHLRRALELLDELAQLGIQSPLASPYFLGEALRGAEASAQGRGVALRMLILRATERLWGGQLPDDGQAMLTAALAENDPGGRYDCLVLELNYFKERYRPAPRNQAKIYSDILHELDALRPADSAQARPAHAQILAFLDGLRGHTPLLLIGQRVFWGHDALIELGALTRADYNGPVCQDTESGDYPCSLLPSLLQNA